MENNRATGRSGLGNACIRYVEAQQRLSEKGFRVDGGKKSPTGGG
jgi:hypothetical protein